MKHNLHILDQDSSILKELRLKSQLLNHLDKILHLYLPPESHSHYRVANFREGVLIIQIDSPVWATHLRLRVANLLQLIHNNHPEINKIEWFVDPKKFNI